jgi:ATP-dependent DNA helicase RecG
MFGGKIYDRHAVDGDIDITRNSEMVAHIHRRKSADYSERKVFPYAKEQDFEFARLIPIVRRLAVNNQKDHPWEKMTDKDIIKSAGLHQTDLVTGQSGYNLAAVLLFGREELIRTCTPNYITDAICRRDNLDRYDDRLRVTVNLIDAYEKLIEFINKHTLDRFFLINDQRVSVRSWIARELVSNILVHREFTSAYTAKIIIERDRIVSENWNLPKMPGRIDPHDFTPYSKNPIIANFFVNIGRADELGSGVRNLYKFTKIYSGGEPALIDGDVFRTIVPLNLPDGSASDVVSNNYGMSNNVSNNVSNNDRSFNNLSTIDGVSDNLSNNNAMSSKLSNNDRKPGEISGKTYHDVILAYIAENSEISKSRAAELIGCHPKTAQRLLSQLVKDGVLLATGANRNRKYIVAKSFDETSD